MFYKEHKLYGPYLSKDGRLRIYLKYLDGTNTTISYPKYLVEKEINRILNINETIDHIDGNPLNNDLDNLRIINRKEHSIQDIKRLYDLKVKCIFFFNDTATTEIYTLSLHDALPILASTTRRVSSGVMASRT